MTALRSLIEGILIWTGTSRDSGAVLNEEGDGSLEVMLLFISGETVGTGIATASESPLLVVRGNIAKMKIIKIVMNDSCIKFPL